MVELKVARDYQSRVINKSIEYLNDPKQLRPVVVVVPTAGGKSYIISEVVKKWDSPTLILQPSQELLEQNLESFIEVGGEATIFSASLKQKDLSRTIYATLGSVKKVIPELIALGIRTVICDECHYKMSADEGSEFTKFMNELKPKKVIGFTATPIILKSTMEGAELKMMTRMKKKYFSSILDVVQVSEIVEKGFWSKIVYETYKFDESGLAYNTSGSDFTDESVKQAIKAQGINNNILVRIRQLLKKGCPSILCFVDSIDTAETMVKHLPPGSSNFISGKTPKKERQKMIADYKSGRLKVLVNFGVLTTGFNYPDLRCIIMGRPTLSLALYYQIIGRGTRISKETGKEECLYIDFCNNVERFGKIENLEIIDVPNWGYGMFNSGILLTNTPMAGTKRHISSLGKPKEATPFVGKIWFGKFEGMEIQDLPMWYMDFMLEKFDFKGSEKMRELKVTLEAIKKHNKELQFKN